MSNPPQNLRKAAVLIRSLDAETAASLLAQLPPAEADAVCAVISNLSAIDPEEQADLAAELRRVVPESRIKSHGVELSLSSRVTSADLLTPAGDEYIAGISLEREPLTKSNSSDQPFEFLESAPISSLVRFLAREHAQTIAVVLSKLSPGRAAALLAALPARLQADVLERLSELGESDTESVKVVEQELAAWVTTQSSRHDANQARGIVDAILSAADPKSRDAILANIGGCNRHLAEKFTAPPAVSKPRAVTPKSPPPVIRENDSAKHVGSQLDALRLKTAAMRNEEEQQVRRNAPAAHHRSPAPRMRFDDLASLDATKLAAVLREIDVELLVLALAGATEEVVGQFAGKLPRKVSKAIRRRIQNLGPTRLSDMEEAQQTIAKLAGKQQQHFAATFAEDSTHMATIIRKDDARETISGPAVQVAAFSFADMRGRANDYLDTVRSETAKIVQQAHQDAERIRRQAEAAGRKAAESAVERMLNEKVAQRMETLIPALERTAAQLDDAKGELLRQWETAAIRVATAMAERIIRRELAHEPQIALEIIAEALRLATGSGDITVRVNPNDYEHMGNQIERLAATVCHVAPTQIVADPDITPGGCRVTTRFGQIDQQIESQLRRIEQDLE